MTQRDWIEKDFYRELGVASGATQDEIKKAYRKLARELHPDANPGDTKAEARIKSVSEAYGVLSDEKKRKEYDETRALFAGGGGGFGGAGFPGGFGTGAPGGQPFDPSVHEAVQHESAEVTGPSVTVVSAVLRRGYRIGDRVLRPAMVGVVDRADDGTTTETPPEGTSVVDPAAPTD